MSDSNLLLGLLALQHGFVSNEQLTSAIGTWTRDKTMSIGEILVEQGAVPAGVDAVLTQLTEAHLAIHDHDFQRSIHALKSLDDKVQEDLKALHDTDLEATLAATTQASQASHSSTRVDPGATIDFSKEKTTSNGRFEKLRPHAEGGIGEVWVALDRELNREVALKLIKSEYATNHDSRSRFVAEAEITGGLEHPGIVPLYALETDEAGRQQYAMRFIRGSSLKEAADDFHENEWPTDTLRSLELRKLLRRMVDVCDTMQYAHSRGVIHRDLKPANVMLGKFGETLVVDWGLAKSTGRSDDSKFDGEITLQPTSGSSSTPTQFGKAVGTPAYMPPEQAAGHLDRLNTESDVYSLGATLYYVLTGQPPYTETELGAILRAVQRGKFVRPRQVKSTVPRPLEAICLKAMALEKKDRYSTPAQLADDIERYLADEPISAYVEPLSVRSQRFMRRHPRLIGSLAATLLVGLVSTVAIAVVVSGKNQQLESKDSQLLAANTSRKEAEEVAKTKIKEAADAKKEVAALYNYMKQISKGATFPLETAKVRQKILGDKWMAFELLWMLSQSKMGKEKVSEFQQALRQVAGKTPVVPESKGGKPKPAAPSLFQTPQGVKQLIDIFGKLKGKKGKSEKAKGETGKEGNKARGKSEKGEEGKGSVNDGN